MCGIVGAVGTLEYKHRQVMRELLFLDTLRGKDSTGLAAIRRNKGVCTRKMTVPGYEFLEHPVCDKTMAHNDQLWIGHNRFKTTGEVSKANAHPFEVLDENGDVLLVGAHNGTLHNKYTLDSELDEKFDTDSEALFNYMVVADDFKKAISKLRGAWSLVWWDPTTDCLHFCRNIERPMTFAYTKDRKVLFYASEAWMIINAARRNGVELARNAKGMSCYSTNPDTLYTMEIPQEIGKELPDLVREGGYSGAPKSNFQAGYHGFREWWNGIDEEDEKKAAEGKEKTETAGEEKKVIFLGDTIRGFGGELLPMEQFRKIQRKGCGWCKGSIKEGDRYAFLSEDTLVCALCKEDRHPKGECLRRGTDADEEVDEFLDDDLPFELGPAAKDCDTLIGIASRGAAKSAVG